MKLIIARHGETEENRKEIMQGHLPGKLSTNGKKQIKRLGLKLKNTKIDVIFSSDLKRAEETAKAVAKYHSTPVRIYYTKLLRERNLGIHEGKRYKDMDPLLKGQLNILEFKPEGGESISELRKRVIRFSKKLHKDYPNKTVLIVTHGHVVRAFNHLYSGISMEEAMKFKHKNASILTFNVE